MGFLAFFRIFGVVPGWAWAALLAASVAYGGVVTVQRSTARSDASAAKTALAQTELAVAENKIRAAHLLAGEVQKNIDAEARFAALTNQLEEARDIAQSENRAAVAARAVGKRLQFAIDKADRRGGGSGVPEAETPRAAADPSPTIVQLPEPINRNLWGYAGDAQSLAIDYGILYSWAHNPKMVCVMGE